MGGDSIDVYHEIMHEWRWMTGAAATVNLKIAWLPRKNVLSELCTENNGSYFENNFR